MSPVQHPKVEIHINTPMTGEICSNLGGLIPVDLQHWTDDIRTADADLPSRTFTVNFHLSLYLMATIHNDNLNT